MRVMKLKQHGTQVLLRIHPNQVVGYYRPSGAEFTRIDVTTATAGGNSGHYDVQEAPELIDQVFDS